MKTIPLKLIGINKEQSAYDQEVNQWSDANNIRFYMGSTERSKGYVSTMEDTSATLVEPHWVHPWVTTTTAYWVVGGNQRVFYTTGNGAYTDITRVLSTASPSSPLSSTNTSVTVSVLSTAHGYTTGDWITLTGYTMSTSGLVEAEVNKTHEITVTDANNFTFDVTTAASATVASFGGTGTTDKKDLYTTDSTLWTGGVLSGVLIINNGVDEPQSMLPSDTNLDDLANFPASTTCKIIRPFKNYLIALHTTESGTEYPFRVRWSHAAEPGAVPSSWDETDGTLDAGVNDLSQTPGAVVDCLTLRDLNIIYKDDSVWSMQYTGGAFIFNFQQLFDDVGILNYRCVKGYDNKHFVVGRNDVYTHDGVNKVSIIHRQMRDWLYNSIDVANYGKTFVTANYPKSEMWICFPETGEETCTKALVWNWRDDSWSTRDLPNITHVGWGIINDSTETVSWDSDTSSWNDDDTAWGERTYNPTDLKLVFVSPITNELIQGDIGINDNGVNYLSYIERKGLTFGTEKVKHIHAIYPKIEGNGPVLFKIGQETGVGGAVAYNDYTFDPTTDYKLDTRVSGRYLSIRVESIEGNQFKLESMDVVMSIDGER